MVPNEEYECYLSKPNSNVCSLSLLQSVPKSVCSVRNDKPLKMHFFMSAENMCRNRLPFDDPLRYFCAIR